MKARTLVFALVLVGTFLVVSTASATTYFRFCADWLTNYTDNGYGEDYFYETGDNLRSAQFTHAKIYRKSGAYWVQAWEGTLDSDSCTGYISVTASTDYRLYRYTWLETADSKEVYVMADDVEWEPTPVSEYWGYSTGAYLFNGYFTHDFSSLSMALTKETKIGAVMTRLLGNGSTLGYLSNHITYISTDNAAPTQVCTGTMGMPDIDTDEHAVCIVGEHVNKKFVIAHEMGHKIAGMNDGPRRGDDGGDHGVFGDTDSDERCNCDHISTDEGHCLNSREHFGKGNAEGFAHFISASTFNNRSQSTNNGGFAYYKRVRRPSGDNTVPNYFSPPYQVDLTDNETWMESECSVSSGDSRGTEWDWLQFYWNTYTDGADWITIDKIMDVWDQIPRYKAYYCCAGTSCTQWWTDPVGCIPPAVTVCRGKPWSDIWARVLVDSNLTQGQKNQFDDMADAAGVRY
ncbi:MAG: hypothetical protein MUC50_17670 [Myxococcota bacterium]|jgi:hypothetical protein|nr:hypothetical protein [Myxococcota bacterium]